MLSHTCVNRLCACMPHATRLLLTYTCKNLSTTMCAYAACNTTFIVSYLWKPINFERVCCMQHNFVCVACNITFVVSYLWKPIDFVRVCCMQHNFACRDLVAVSERYFMIIWLVNCFILVKICLFRAFVPRACVAHSTTLSAVIWWLCQRDTSWQFDQSNLD